MALRKILFVDDDPRILSAMRRRLSTDYNVVTFERGNDAVDYIKNNEDISVLIADMRMPEMDGLELLKHSQDIRPDLKRVMLTGNSDQKTAVDAINEGQVFRFLKKPCDSIQIKAVIDTAIEETAFAEADIADISKRASNATDNGDQEKLFLSVMSEELRTPLSQVIAISDTLSKQELLINERARGRMLRQIGEAGQNALTQVDRILTFVKLQSDTSKRSLPNVRLDQIVSEEINRIRSEAAERNVTISFESNLVPLEVHSNRESIQIAVREALSNAVKFNEDNGHVSVQIKANQNKAAMRIANAGRHLPATGALTGTVFNPSDSSLSREYYGMGLGLSLINAAAISGNFKYDLWPRDNGGAWLTFVFECNEPESRQTRN